MNNNYAVVEINGRQFCVERNKYYDFNKLSIQLNKNILLNRILFYSSIDFIYIGEPYLNNIHINGKVLKHFKGKKTIIYKMKPKKKTRKKQGHRQNFSRILINHIGLINS